MTNDKENYDLIVVGAGPAGLTAGIFGARSGLKTLVLDKGICGGLTNEATLIDNYPGFRRIGGMELIEKIKAQTADYAEIQELEGVVTIEAPEHVETMRVVTEKGEYRTSAIILATGTKKRKLGVKGEAEFLGRGISYCATCDGYFFRNKAVMVVGGGDSAVRGALYLQNIGAEVSLIHRREELRAEQYLQTALKEAGIHIFWNSILKEIRGEKVVRSVLLHDKARDSEEEVPVEGVFIYVGEDPANSLALQLHLMLDANGYISTDRGQRTSRTGIYAAGDVTGGVRQIVVACAEGAVAASSAYDDLVG
ncbi:MAG: FAD-dependent oxidoreductase [Methanomicrobia archaeon]|nr:FAD-dependent oxidoreductase [Methanomicrobia archaeon]